MEALEGVVIVVGGIAHGPGALGERWNLRTPSSAWAPIGRPEAQLRECVRESRRVS
jgi:hypothetical protein